MKTIAEIFLRSRDELRTYQEADGSKFTNEFMCRLFEEYLHQEDLPTFDRQFSPSIFKLVTSSLLCHAPPQQPSPQQPSPPVPPRTANNALIVILVVLTLGLAVSLFHGWTVLAVLCTAAIAGIAYLATRGAFPFFTWMFCSKRFGRIAAIAGITYLATRGTFPFFTRKPDEIGGSTTTDEIRSANKSWSEQLENICRKMDALFADMRVLTATRAQPRPDVTMTSLQFLQDLAEAKIAHDEHFAMSIVEKRLESFLRDLGLELVSYTDDRAGCFRVDNVVEPSRAGTSETIRPAIMAHDSCLTSGYARQFLANADNDGEMTQ